MNSRPLFLSHPCPYCGAGRGTACHEIVRGNSGPASAYPFRPLESSHRDREPMSGVVPGSGLLSELATLWVRGVL